jgi:hypothetical protein
MCYRRSRYWDQDAREMRGERLWDLFYRETEHSEAPLPVLEQEEEIRAEDDRDEVPVGGKR